MSTSGANGVATLTDNDSAANQVYTQTNTIQSSGATTVSSTGHGNTIDLNGVTISEAGQRPSDPLNSFTDMGNNDVVNVGAVSVGKLGSPDGGTVIFGAGTTGEVVDATAGGVKVDEGNDASAIINGGVNGGMNQITLGTGDQVLDNGWDMVTGGSSDVIDVGANDVTYVNESGVDIVGKTGDTIDVTGTNDHIYADSSNIEINGADTGDIVYGSGDTGDTGDWGGYVNEGGSYGGYTGGGYYYAAVARRVRGASRESRTSAHASQQGVDISTLATGHTLVQAENSTVSSAQTGAQQLIHAMSRWPAEGALQINDPEASQMDQHSMLAAAPLLRARSLHAGVGFR